MSKIGYLTESSTYFTKEEARLEASRCILSEELECNKPCLIGVSPKEIIELVAKGDIETAVELLRDKNPIAAITSRVCPCSVHATIQSIEKFLTNYEKENNLIKIKKEVTNYDNKVAIIGSGPSGLTSAAMLARKGYNITVFEEREELGGWLSYGIPPHRLPKSVIKQDIDYIKSLGVNFVTNCKVGKDTTIEALRKEGFKAFLICTGFNKGRILKVKGYELNGVIDAVSFLADAKSKDGNISTGKSAIVIGGGDVAIDCGTTAKLTGYDKVRLVVRGSLESMTAAEKSLAYLHKVKVPIFDNFDSYEIIGDKNGNVCAMEFVGLKGDTSKLRLEADTVIFAVGQYPDGIKEIANVNLDERGSVITNNFQTSIEDIFAAGDIVEGQKTVCGATALGKEAACSIDKYFNKVKQIATI